MSTKVIFGGDVMLGRMVASVMLEEGYQYPLAEITKVLQSSDITIVNLECAITSSHQKWRGHEKAFYFGSIPEAALTLKEAGIDVVSLANNHILDFDYQGLSDTIQLLDEQKIKHAGAGENLSESKKAVVFDANGISFAMTSYCDHQEDFAATANTPGMNYLDLTSVDTALAQLEKDFENEIPDNINWPILALHWGPNMVLKPSKDFQEIAHGAVDIGYKILFGHSAHVPHGIEMYQQRPILYALGDLVDDYMVDDYYKNDHGLLFELTLDKEKILELKALPIFIRKFQTRPATQQEFEFIAQRFSDQCAALGTIVSVSRNKIAVSL